ncbi:MAG TPA: FAD-dependent oxidoreductase [Streptosporangiaceae bacterium]|nr:FAD-dependent oxidoreductase [Streptosporangiaceae bacterium]
MRCDVVVVGGGLFGLSAAWSVTRRGHDVVVVDQGVTGHLGGGSHGSCRIFRLGYDDPRYVPLVRRARRVWTELEELSGERLLIPTPQLTFGPLVGEVRAGLEQAGAPYELLSAAEAGQRFPGVGLAGIDQVLYEPESAVTAADRTLAVLAALVQPRVGRVTGLAANGSADGSAGGSGVKVSLADGEVRDADVAIVCAGPWTGRLVAAAGIAVPGTTSLEQVAYFEPANGAAGTAGAASPPMPIIINYGGEFPYGLPVPGTNRYKLGIHFGGPTIDPDDQSQAEDTALTRQIQRAAAEFLPGYDPVPVAVERCIYDNSPDTDFIIDRIGDVVVGCGTSGHGFKFGPLIGEWLAQLALGEGPGGSPDAGPPPAWLGLSRFAADESASAAAACP